MKKYILKVELPRRPGEWTWAYYQSSSILLNNWPGFTSTLDNGERFATKEEALVNVDAIVKLMKGLLAWEDPMGALRGFSDEEKRLRESAEVVLAPGETEE